MVKVNGKNINGPAGCLVALATLLFIGVVFAVIAIILTAPIWILLTIGALIGKML